MSQSNQCANMFLSVKKKNLTPIPYCAMVQFRMSMNMPPKVISNTVLQYGPAVYKELTNCSTYIRGLEIDIMC